MQELINNKVTQLWMREDKRVIMFVVEGKQGKTEGLMYATEADCCNDVWFESFNNLSGLNHARVVSIEEKGWNTLKEGGYEVLEAGFWTIKTSKGYVDIEVRNSHNGYYGGDVCLIPAHMHYELFLTDKTWKKLMPVAK